MAEPDRNTRLPEITCFAGKMRPFSHHVLPRPPSAPSPTGFSLHIGGALPPSSPGSRPPSVAVHPAHRDTDVARSTQEAVDGIRYERWLAPRTWSDEGPFYQMRRMDRYKESWRRGRGRGTVATTSPGELDAMRRAQTRARQKPCCDDARWRQAGQTLPEPPAGVQPVIRFAARPTASSAGTTRSKRAASNSQQRHELVDLIIARARTARRPQLLRCRHLASWTRRSPASSAGDDRVNGTPRQISIHTGRSARRYRPTRTVSDDPPATTGQKLSRAAVAVDSR